MRRGRACQRAKAEGSIDEKGVRGCGDGKRGDSEAEVGRGGSFFSAVSPTHPPGHVLCPYTCSPHGPSLHASYIQTAHGPPLHIHSPPLHVPTHADAPYSPPLASPMPHTARTLQHAPAVPTLPQHALTHDNTPSAHMDPIRVLPPPHGMYLTAPTCCPPILMLE